MATRLSMILLVAPLLSQGCVGPPTKESDTLSGITQLTTGFTRAGPASFSPDMKWVVFQATPPNEPLDQIYVAPVRSAGDRISGLGTPIRLTPKGSRNSGPVFTPDGKAILFASSGGRSVSEPEPPSSRPGDLVWSFPRGIEVVRVDGWQSAIAMPEPGKSLDLPQTPLTKFDAYSAECAVSPDGRHVAFASSRDASGDVELYAMRPDGTGVVRITHARGYDGGPAFSPDGKRLLFRSDRAGTGRLQLYLLDLVYDAKGNLTATTRERVPRSTPYVNVAPTWHPSGDFVLYASDDQGKDNFELRMARRSGRQDCRITFTNGFDGFPTFSPDGRRLLWSSKRTADGTVQLFVADFRVPPYMNVLWDDGDEP